MKFYYRVIPSLSDPRSDNDVLQETEDAPVYEPSDLAADPGESLDDLESSATPPIVNVRAQMFRGYAFQFWNVTSGGVAVGDFPTPNERLTTSTGDTATAWYLPEGGDPIFNGGPGLIVRAFDADADRFRRMTPIERVLPEKLWQGGNHRDVTITESDVDVWVKDYLGEKAFHRWVIRAGVSASGYQLHGTRNVNGYAVVSYKHKNPPPPIFPGHDNAWQDIVLFPEMDRPEGGGSWVERLEAKINAILRIIRNGGGGQPPRPQPNGDLAGRLKALQGGAALRGAVALAVRMSVDAARSDRDLDVDAIVERAIAHALKNG